MDHRTNLNTRDMKIDSTSICIELQRLAMYMLYCKYQVKGIGSKYLTHLRNEAVNTVMGLWLFYGIISLMYMIIKNFSTRKIYDVTDFVFCLHSYLSVISQLFWGSVFSFSAQTICKKKQFRYSLQMRLCYQHGLFWNFKFHNP